MLVPDEDKIIKAVMALKDGGVIAYPTEGVYGFGADPFNEKAVLKLLHLKQRSVHKGLLLIAHTWEIVEKYTAKIDPKILQSVLRTWPGPITWVFPANLNLVPKWILGDFTSLAIRITAHPIARAILEKWQGPMVSTSANIEGQKPLQTFLEVSLAFAKDLDYVVEGAIGDLQKPTPIYDVLTQKIIRP